MEFSSAGKHDDGDFGIAEDGELVGLFEEAVASLGVGDLPVRRVFDSLDLDLPSRHRRRPFDSCSNSSRVLFWFDLWKREKWRRRRRRREMESKL